MEEAEIIVGVGALARAHGVSDPVDVSRLSRVRGGNSSEIWAFDGRWGGVTRPLILRSGADNEFSFAGRAMEYRVLKSLESSGLPIPRVYWFDSDGAHMGRQSMVMERSPGVAERTILTERNRLGLDAAQRAALGLEMIELLARLHAVTLSPEQVGGTAGASKSAAQQLAEHDAAIEKLELEPMVELRIASWWLWRHLPAAPRRPTIVHGDYRPANMLVENGHVSAILDWEFTSIGDPLEDLGWYLSPYYSAEHFVPGHLSEEDVIRRYEAASGVIVDRAAVRFWGVYAIYKLAYMTIAALRWMADGDASRMAGSAAPVLKPLLAAIVDPDPATKDALR